MGFVLRVLINAAALWVAAAVIPGIVLRGLRYTLLAALVLGLINAIVRPVLVFLTLPIMTAWRTPSCLKALISRWSWPSAIQWIRSTTFSSEGSVSPVKATAETR